MQRNIDELFGIEPTEITEPKDIVSSTKNALANVQKNYELVFAGADAEFDDDFVEVKDNLRGIIKDCSDKVMKVGLLAEESEKAAHFTAYAALMATLLSANKQLIELYDAKKKYYIPPKGSLQGTTAVENATQVNIQNAVFTGTTADLKRYIEDLKNGDVD